MTTRETITPSGARGNHGHKRARKHRFRSKDHYMLLFLSIKNTIFTFGSPHSDQAHRGALAALYSGGCAAMLYGRILFAYTAARRGKRKRRQGH